MSLPGLDLTVVNYRTPGDLAGFLASLDANLPTCAWELTIVNVAPQDADTDVAEAYMGRHHGGRYISFAENVGYARACNAAGAEGDREVLGLFNADVRITPGSLDACHEAIFNDACWAVLGPRQVDDTGRLTAAGIFGSATAPVHRGWHQPSSPGLYEDVRDDAVVVSGAALFMRRRVWDELTACAAGPGGQGAFLPTPHYYEETWCCYHAQAHGYRCIYWGPTTMVHRWHQASALGGWADQQMAVSREMFRSACSAHGIGCD